MTIMEQAEVYVGITEETDAHHAIIDEFNNTLAARVGYAMTYFDAWCAAFASLCAYKSGAGLPYGVNCQTIKEKAEAMGQWSNEPRVGGYVLYDYNGDYVPEHIGIVVKVDQWSLETIEGNWCNSVCKRSLLRSDHQILGYVHPDATGGSIAAGDPRPVLDTLSTLTYGARGRAVMGLQALLNLRGYSVGRWGVDGDFGGDTLNAVTLANRARLGKDSGEASPTLIIDLFNH